MASAPSFIARVQQTIKGLVSSEGSWRGPFNGMGENGNMFQMGELEDGWQRNLFVNGMTARHVPTAYACVMSIARATSQCYPLHVRKTGNSYEQVTNSAAFRVMNRPNSYQTTPGFLLNMIATALFEGEAFAFATRNDRNEVNAIHPMANTSTSVRIAEDGSIYYAFGSNQLAGTDPSFIVPARDVIHLKFHTPRHPLIGESPIKAAALAVGINVALSTSQNAFFNRMNRASGILSTEQSLTKEQMMRLREAFDAQSKSWAQGGMPILSNGLKFQQLSVNSQDAQLVEAQRMSIEEICRVYGVPPELVGSTGKTANSNTEALISHWLSISLGSYLEHTERTFDALFGLSGTDYIELDTTALLRTSFEKRIEALTKAVQGGLFTPDEARGKEGYGPTPGGNSAFLQRQMVPVNRINEILDNELAKVAANAAPPAAPPVTDEPEPSPDDVKALMNKFLAMKVKA
jgi:HK97 family phage portal protein